MEDQLRRSDEPTEVARRRRLSLPDGGVPILTAMLAKSSGQLDRALIEAGMILTSELSLDAVLQRIVELAVEITGARYGALGVLTPTTVPSSSSSPSVSPLRNGPRSVTHRLATGSWACSSRGIVRFAYRTSAPTRDRSASRRTTLRCTRSWGPCEARGTIFGNIYLTEKRGASEFSEEDEAGLVVLASQAGIATENARLYHETQRQQRELQRMSTARGTRTHREGVA